MHASAQIGFIATLGILAGLTACGSAPPAAGHGPEDSHMVVDGGYADDKVICRRQRVVGSNVPVRVCKTESQMRAEREALEKTIGSLRPFTGDTRQMDVNTIPQH